MDLLIHVDKIRSPGCEEKIRRKLSAISGVELVLVDAEEGKVHITGGDVDEMEIRDLIEGMGFRTT